jgi:hypothetical protein
MNLAEKGMDNWAAIGESVSTVLPGCASGIDGQLLPTDPPLQLKSDDNEQLTKPCRHCGGAGYYASSQPQ